MCLLLVNLLLLANLKERSTCRELDYFLEVVDNVLEVDNLVNKVTNNVLESYSIISKESLTLFLRMKFESLFFCLSSIIIFVSDMQSLDTSFFYLIFFSFSIYFYFSLNLKLGLE